MAAVFIILHCRKVEKNYNNIIIARTLQEQDCTRREPSNTRLEKETVEKVLIAQLTEVIKSTHLKAMEERPATDSDK